MPTIRVDQANHAQLQYLATVTLGLSIAGSPTKGELVALIRASGYSSREFTIDDDAVLDTGATMASAPKTDDSYTHVRCIIHHEEKPGGHDHVPVSVNGRAIWIPRGEPCVLKRRYWLVLVAAKEVHYPERQRIDNDTPALGTPLMAPRHAVQFIEFITDPDPERDFNKHVAAA